MLLGKGGLPVSDADHYLMFHGKSKSHKKRRATKQEREEQQNKETQQVHMAYEMIRNGFTEIEILMRLQQLFGEAARPDACYGKGLELVINEQKRIQKSLPDITASMRMKVLQHSIATGQVSTAAALLRDMEPAEADGGMSQDEMTLRIELADSTAEEPYEASAHQSTPRLAPAEGL